CAGKELDWVRETSAKFQAKIAQGQLPQPRVETPERGRAPSGGKLTSDDAKGVFAGFLALMAVAVAYDIEHPTGPSGYSSGTDVDLEIRNRERQRTENCILRNGVISTCF